MTAVTEELYIHATMKTGSDCVNVTCCSRLFQMGAVTTEQAQSPTVDRVDSYTISDSDEAECRRCQALKSASWRSASARYDSAATC